MVSEIEQQARNFSLQPETIFFGGGTPTALTTKQLEFLLTGFRRTLDLTHLREWTVEANPGSVSAKKAALLHSLGVNRISLGVQSWDDRLLRLLGREHNAAEAEKSFRLLRDTGFANINIDLMFGLPGQTEQQWRATLKRTVALAPDHVSAYCLTYEEDTEFFLRHAGGEFRASSEADAQFFETTMEVLEDASYSQYEISNYARPGSESVHNQAYWRGADYLGVGPSAFSTIGQRRWQNIADYRAYSDRVLKHESLVVNEEAIPAQTRRAETIALSLRTRGGVPARWLAHSADATSEFIALGLLEKADDRFVLTRRGKLLADAVAEAFI
jgi:oxygen-independent coproporphyrinogen-3 oxidase